MPFELDEASKKFTRFTRFRSRSEQENREEASRRIGKRWHFLQNRKTPSEALFCPRI